MGSYGIISRQGAVANRDIPCQRHTGVDTASYGYNQDDQPITSSLPGSLSGTMGYNPNGQLTA